MSKHMEIRNGVFERLKTIKGNGSWSDAIESLLDKCRVAPVQPAKTETDAASASEGEIS